MMKKNIKLIVADKGWAETAPEWLLGEVEMERTAQAFASLLGNMRRKKIPKEVGDAEACLYLYTLSLRVPMNHEYGNIYLFLCNRMMERQGMEIPEDVRVDGLSDWEASLLQGLKSDLWRKRGGKITTSLTDALLEVFLKKEGKKERNHAKIILEKENEN